jgi:hypothetical protein
MNIPTFDDYLNMPENGGKGTFILTVERRDEYGFATIRVLSVMGSSDRDKGRLFRVCNNRLVPLAEDGHEFIPLAEKTT